MGGKNGKREWVMAHAYMGMDIGMGGKNGSGCGNNGGRDEAGVGWGREGVGRMDEYEAVMDAFIYLYSRLGGSRYMRNHSL